MYKKAWWRNRTAASGQKRNMEKCCAITALPLHLYQNYNSALDVEKYCHLLRSALFGSDREVYPSLRPGVMVKYRATDGTRQGTLHSSPEINSSPAAHGQPGQSWTPELPPASVRCIMIRSDALWVVPSRHCRAMIGGLIVLTCHFYLVKWS